MEIAKTSLGNGELYAPSMADKFLWWMATAEKELISDCVVDRNRYRIIGAAVMATWLFATLAWTYFFSTAIGNPFAFIPLGIFMGGVILCIDRALMKGINKFNKRKVVPLLVRGLLALTIGAFMAQPAVLFLFDKEIQQQASLDNEKRKLVKNEAVAALYEPAKQQLERGKKSLENELTRKYAEVSAARNQFIGETDGSSGSGKIGISNIALAKKKLYDELAQQYSGLEKSARAKIDSLDAATAVIEKAVQQEKNNYVILLNDGFLVRIQALRNLIKDNDAMAYRYYLILVILVLIELLPVITKTMLPAGVYDEKVQLRENLEKEMAISNIGREKQLKELYNQLTTLEDETAIRNFFELTRDDRKLKIRKLGNKWKNEENGSFGDYWEQIKREVLTRQEG